MNPLSATQVETSAHAIAAEAASAQYPGRSAAALVRHRMAHYTRDDRARVTARALEILSTGRPAGATTIEPEMLTVPEAARHLRISARTVKRMLRTVAGRRSLGWPRWAGRWLIPRAAIIADMAPAFLARLPEREPWPADTLPEWVEIDA